MANAAKNLSSGAMEKRKRKLAATPKKTSNGLNISGKRTGSLYVVVCSFCSFSHPELYFYDTLFFSVCLVFFQSS
ncbi:MAG TPA: hypothetical protein GX699_10975 [Firmicutes bacterium]|nr:hypothetical protein [Bacillota bacterium]